MLSDTARNAVAMVDRNIILFPAVSLMFWLKGVNLEKMCNSSLKVRKLTAPNESFYT